MKKVKRKETKQRTKSEKHEEEIFKEKLIGLNCPYCNKFLTSKHSLHDHIRVKHEYINYSERFLCDVSDNQMQVLHFLIAIPFFKICGKDFPLKYYLLRHIRASHLKTLSYKKKETENPVIFSFLLLYLCIS